MSEPWKAGQDIHDMVKKLVAANHPDIILVVDEIVVIFKEKAGKTGGQVTLGVSRKVPPLANAIGNTNYKFVLEIAADQWEHGLDSTQREALLDHLLCQCRADEDGKTGEPKCYIAKPDISAFRENVERYGMWFPKEAAETDEDAEKKDAVRDMFGDAVG